MTAMSWATEPGSPHRPNEDFVVAAPDAVVVLDGCSLPLGTDLGCLHGTAWYARSLGRRLLSRALRDGDGTLADGLSGAVEDVAGMHAGTCDLRHPLTPASTVVALRVRGGRAEYLVLADSTLLLAGAAGLQVVTPPVVTAYAAADPAVSRLAITGDVPLSGLRLALLMTDGATRLADLFGLSDWPGLMRLAETDGPAALIERTREAERSDPHGSRWPRTKPQDDATAALWRFAP